MRPRSPAASRPPFARASTPAPTRATELGAELRRLGAAEVELRQAAEEVSERATAVEVELARLEGEAVEAQRRLDEAVGTGAGQEVESPDADGDVDRDELAARITRLDARREALGKVNPLARGGVRGGEGAPRRADAPAHRSRGSRSASSRRSATS